VSRGFYFVKVRWVKFYKDRSLDGWAGFVIYKLSARSTEKLLMRWGVWSSLLFGLPGSDNSIAYPIQAPFEVGQEESQIESCSVL
jgi:hypothetical protein